MKVEKCYKLIFTPEELEALNLLYKIAIPNSSHNNQQSVFDFIISHNVNNETFTGLTLLLDFTQNVILNEKELNLWNELNNVRLEYLKSMNK